jgi:FAD synthetase
MLHAYYNQRSPAFSVLASLQVVFVPDDVSAIASEVASLSSSCAAVITSGGVGPTLDDVTMEGIAAAFGVDVMR